MVLNNKLAYKKMEFTDWKIGRRSFLANACKHLLNELCKLKHKHCRCHIRLCMAITLNENLWKGRTL